MAGRIRFAAAGVFGVALALAGPASASPITVTFTAVSGADTVSGSFTYEGSVSGAGTITGPPYGGSVTFPSSTFASSDVRWVVQTSPCFTGAPCATIGLTAPVGPGLERLSTLYFDFPSLPSTSLPDPATLASASTLAFLDLVVDPDGSVQEFLFAGSVTSLSFVPEPRGAVLLAAAAAALSALRRRAA